MSTATIPLSNPDEIRTLFGAQDANLRRIREAVGVSAVLRGDMLTLEGEESQVKRGQEVVESLQTIIARSGGLSEQDVQRALDHTSPTAAAPSAIDLFEKARRVAPKTPGQAEYVEAIKQHDLVFCRGPAGCGKTFLAVAMGVNALRREQVRKIVLVRPAVEAGERLGFLPGDLLAKVNPFLRPLLDAMQEMLDFDQVRRYMESDVVEIVPLAFMRGRTLNQTFIILDEGQNTTVTQMKMFLTRMGEGSKIVVTGDVTQTDLPQNVESGMQDAIHRLSDIDGVGVVELTGRDIVRHRLVREIVKAYEVSPADRHEAASALGIESRSMFGGSNKRTRQTRTISVRGPETVWSKAAELFRDRGFLLRLGLCLSAIVLVLLLVQSWKAPFPYRVGQREPHGIAAKLDFERIDADATNQLRKNAEDQTPLVFSNNPERLDPLPQQLRSALGEIAQSTSLAELQKLSPEVASGFGLVPVDEKRPSPASIFAARNTDESYARLKQVLGDPEMTSTQALIDDIVHDFERFIDPLRRTGVITPDIVERLSKTQGIKIGPERKLRIIQSDGSAADQELLLPQVRLVDQLNDAGELGKQWLSYPSLTDLRKSLSHWLVMTTPATLQFDQVAWTADRQSAQDRVEPQKQRYIKGDMLVQPGATIDEDRLQLLWDEYTAAEQLVPLPERLSRVGVVALLMLVLIFLNGFYIVRNEPRLAGSLGRLTVYLVAVVSAVALARVLSFASWPVEVIPLLAVCMLLAVAYNQVLATITAFTIAAIVALSATLELTHFIVLMCSACAAIIPLSSVASRSKIVTVGLYAAATYFCVSLGLNVIESQSLNEVFRDWTPVLHALKGAAMCLAASFLVAGTLPFVEKLFDVVTDMSLLELSDPSHPLLQELVRRAPGTYNHSITVGSVAEAAAERIGANGLLVRVGAYFHDIGKMLKPQYFIENIQEGTANRHAQLAPAMSTLIIIGHVKDGIDLAEQHNLPQAIIDFIEQHHGTTLVEYFYHEAAQQAEGDPDHKTDAEESSFRYPGPKPQSKEAGIMMLSDAVESASRALSDPTPRRIETLVHNLTLKRLLDGQFDESTLTLNEIRAIEDSLVKSLIAIYHGRIRYPEVQAQPA